MTSWRHRRRRLWTVAVATFFSVVTFLHQTQLSNYTVHALVPGYFYNPSAEISISGHEYSFQILGDLDVIASWYELSELEKCFRKQEGKPYLKSCSVYCPGCNNNIIFYLSNELSNASNKNALILGVSPFTLVRMSSKLLQYKFPSQQLVVYYSMESPLRMHKWNERVQRIRFHIDMTYMDSSNISLPYATTRETSIADAGIFPPKTGLIAWMGSNCVKEVFWPRMEFIRELGKYVKIDSYGKCGNMSCLPRLSTKCTDMLQKYKFYLALENSECDQYITEKFWASSLRNHVVPIVYGPRKEDYQKLAPKNSFIHVSDFDSTADLARYIKFLDQNDEAYRSYFKWKTSTKVVQLYPKLQLSYFCRVIPILNNDMRGLPVRRVSDLSWFNSCRNKINKRFQPSDVATLESWMPWR
ncbi:Glycoprotein 3-alpha-L-fucosyltransferase A [Holothuria leucospilota]|uniref:Fucosyltransferase n=1 Tax=Holothuria leucospilota TaxID=206669 RepID=A0A9Q1C242_HOLLE|nr:Glycoprotein 3-alpha-L-fucosyltransferase A [Holothuria leucospilota]